MRDLAYEFISNAEDDAILVELLDEFHRQDKQKQDDIICYILGALVGSREIRGMEIGK